MNMACRPAEIFTDNMVLQRNSSVPVWGTVETDSLITVEFMGQAFETFGEKGKWMIYIPTPEAGGPYEMKISCGSSDVTLENILIGEVWLAGGQSNMQLILNDCLGGKEETGKADYPALRYFDVPRNPIEGIGVQGSWKICTPETAKDFSAVAFYFAKNIMQSLNVPVGIIGCNHGGTSASCWVSRECLLSDPDIRIYYDEFEEYLKKINEDDYEKQFVKYEMLVENYNKKVEIFRTENPSAGQGIIETTVGLYPWPPPMGLKAIRRPSGLYYTMLRKVVPYAIKGFIYYQGEEDDYKASLYQKLFGKLIENWRNDWGNKELPFLFVQLPFYNDFLTDENSWPLIREAQLKAMQTINNTAMAVTTDCGEKDNIHPINKKPVGERLALLARAGVYRQTLESLSPIYKEMSIDGCKIVLHFDNCESGLTFSGESLKGFNLCGADGIFVHGTAVINGTSVEVSAQEITSPVAVRYGWGNFTEANLFNLAGLPASPFRTDDFEIIHNDRPYSTIEPEEYP